MFVRLPILISIVLLSLAACAPAQPASKLGPRPTAPARTPTPQPATDEEAIRQLIASEGQGVVSQDIAGLMDLWAADAVLADAKHTPDDPNDECARGGHDAIRERYVGVGLPRQPDDRGCGGCQARLRGDQATTVGPAIGSEVAPGGDRWTFAKQDGRWWITGLTYNLEPE